jgi:hypothetical protein
MTTTNFKKKFDVQRDADLENKVFCLVTLILTLPLDFFLASFFLLKLLSQDKKSFLQEEK